MSSLNNFYLESNSKIKLNFNGDDLSSDSRLFLIKEFAHKIGFHKLIKEIFKTNDNSNRNHKDDENLCQMIYQILAGYFNDDADELTNEPIMNTILNKNGLASRIIHTARYIVFKLCSSCPYQKEFYETLDNIRLLPKLE
jgi:hypothetical protein